MAVSPFNALTNQFTGAVDPANDSIPFWQSSTSEAFWVSNQTWNNILGAVVGTTDSQTLTNKTLTSPTISGPTLSGTLTGTYTIGGTPTFPASVATLTDSQTLTNKTLTSPTVNGGTISNATITSDSVAGFTTSNTGTIYGISVTTGTIGSAALGANSVVTAAINSAAVTATKLGLSVTTLANAGTGGGSMYYINLGGIKFCWGSTAIQTVGSTTSANFTITLPASFFTSIQTFLPTMQPASGSAFCYITGIAATVTTATYAVVNPTATASLGGGCNFLIIGS